MTSGLVTLTMVRIAVFQIIQARREMKTPFCRRGRALQNTWIFSLRQQYNQGVVVTHKAKVRRPTPLLKVVRNASNVDAVVLPEYEDTEAEPIGSNAQSTTLLCR